MLQMISCRPTSRISDGAPDLRRRVADTEACDTVGRVHFIYFADRCMRLLGDSLQYVCSDIYSHP
jgi:hypothetical protein